VYSCEIFDQSVPTRVIKAGQILLDEFDVVIIGAGPAATAVLIGTEQTARLCIVTGSTPGASISKKSIHAKIRSVADSRKEAPGVVDPIKISGWTRPALCTAITGGLANYWGQQFIRYSFSEEWPREHFDGYESYLASCSRIEAEFSLDESNEPSNPNQTTLGAYKACSPRLLVGTKTNARAGLLAVRQLIEQKSIDRRATTIEDRVDSLEPFGENWKAKLSAGNTISARRIVLAAGVLGTACLLMRSFPEIKSVRLRDHSPLWLYTFGLNQLVRTTRQGADLHFNVQTLQRETDEGAVLYASVYNMQYVDLKDVFNMLIGKPISVLAGLRAPWPVNWVSPVQVWTKSTTTAVCIEKGDNSAHVIQQPNFRIDPELSKFIATIRKGGALVVKVSETSPLQGFHFYGLEISVDNHRYIPIKEYLEQCSCGSLVCADASVLNRISCRPHTETAMATAMQIATNLR
jgi:hypothetical protein